MKTLIFILILILILPINSINLNEEKKLQNNKINDDIEKQIFNVNEKRLKKLTNVEKIVWAFRSIDKDPLL